MTLKLSGERFTAIYRLVAADEDEARKRAEDICIEQTIEFPADLVDEPAIREQIFGRLERLQLDGEGHFEAAIAFPVECAGAELPQLLNVLFGNISIKPGIRLQRLEAPPALLSRFQGPRFGRAGLRELLGAGQRPLLCSAIKPMGLSTERLADQAYRFALGGIDLIKDDHGFANQSFSPFEERVQRCCEAVERANRETGGGSRYLPSVSGPDGQTLRRARFASAAGAGGLLISPGLVGLDTMRRVAEDDAVGLPILSHPALQGSFVTSPDQGIAHGCLFGQLNRLAGADGVIFPHAGGRFSFSVDECRDLAAGTEVAMPGIEPIFPVPAGGMNLGRVSEIVEFYGRDVILLIGGDLHRHGPDLVQSCRKFRALVEQTA